MTCVPRHHLVSHCMVGTACPILGKSAVVSINRLVFVNFRNKSAAIEPPRVVLEPFDSNWVSAAIGEDFRLNLASSSAEPFVLRWHMSSVPRQILLFEVRWSCKSCHFIYLFIYRLN